MGVGVRLGSNLVTLKDERAGALCGRVHLVRVRVRVRIRVRVRVRVRVLAVAFTQSADGHASPGSLVASDFPKALGDAYEVLR